MALQPDTRLRRRWLTSYVDEIVARDGALVDGSRGLIRLRRYLQAWAANTAGVVEHRTLYEAVEINRVTTVGYNRLLDALLVVAEAAPRMFHLRDRDSRHTGQRSPNVSAGGYGWTGRYPPDAPHCAGCPPSAPATARWYYTGWKPTSPRCHPPTAQQLSDPCTTNSTPPGPAPRERRSPRPDALPLEGVHKHPCDRASVPADQWLDWC